MKSRRLWNGCKIGYTLFMKIGTDIINISRIEKSLEKFGDKFKTRFLVEEEIQRAKKLESIAGLWAAKEAVSKALGCGICAELGFHDIIIKKDHKGAPYLSLSIKAQKRFVIRSSSISISHDSQFAIAVVIIDN